MKEIEDFDRERGPRYAAELDAAAEILSWATPIGQVKAIGRLEVAEALRHLFPADDGEPLSDDWLDLQAERDKETDNWILLRLGPTVIELERDGPEGGYCLWLVRTNVAPVDVAKLWQLRTRGDFRLVAKAVQTSGDGSTREMASAMKPVMTVTADGHFEARGELTTISAVPPYAILTLAERASAKIRLRSLEHAQRVALKLYEPITLTGILTYHGRFVADEGSSGDD